MQGERFLEANIGTFNWPAKNEALPLWEELGRKYKARSALRDVREISI